MLVTVTLNQVYVLLVAAAPLPTPRGPRCPDCGEPLRFVTLEPAEAGRCLDPDTS
jgi:uncharacterized protein with PIN domain